MSGHSECLASPATGGEVSATNGPSLKVVDRRFKNQLPTLKFDSWMAGTGESSRCCS